MYTEREMVLDALQIAKSGAVKLTQAATESSNPALRQTLLQMRNNCEQSQQQIGQFAQSKRFYIPAPPAGQQDVASINQFLQQSVNQPTLV
ncbi:MAG TPA: spore coat protein [Firmicutes bacterium]|nr:spore coat protein [Bacillota bacterium]